MVDSEDFRRTLDFVFVLITFNSLTYTHKDAIMPGEATENGVPYPVSTKLDNLTLNERSAAPSPTSDKVDGQERSTVDYGIPDAFLLPNGTPDVSLYRIFTPSIQLLM